MSWPSEHLAAAAACAAGLCLTAAAVPAVAQDAFDGLPAGPGQEEVYYGCNACHSLAIVKQQRLPRGRWEYLMDWMVDEQGMEPFDPETLSLVIDYLSTHYGVPEG